MQKVVKSSNMDGKQLTGQLGEKLVARYFRDKGSIVEESLNHYDRIKDMIIDGKTCEVKTQQLWHKQQAFTVRETQLAKCKEVEYLIFVELPCKINENTVSIFEIPKDKRTTRSMKTNDGRIMYLYNKKDANLLTTIKDNDIIEMFNTYTISKWK